MKPLSSFIAYILLALIFGSSAQAGQLSQKETIDSLRTELDRCVTATDSVSVLYNLYDILPRSASTALGDTIYHVAMRTGDQRTALDIIRNQANRYKKSANELSKLTQWTMACKDSEDRRQTLTFLRLMEDLRIARYSDSVERNKALKAYIEKIGSAESTNIYDHIVSLHGICMLMSEGPAGEILTAYMDSLERLADKLPLADYALRNTLNVHAATIYAIDYPEKSLEADRKVLDDITRLEKYYADKGRIFRNYQASYYTVYTRMLSNFKALTSDQVEEYYQKAVSQIPADTTIRNTYLLAPMPDVYYSLYHKDYDRALKLLTKAINQSYTSGHRIQLMRYIIECAQALGRKDVLLKTYKQYTQALEDEIHQKSSHNFRELQTTYAIYEIKYNVGQMELQRRKAEAKLQKTITAISISALVAALIFLIFLLLQYRRNKRLTKSLTDSNNRLEAESENLKKSRAELIKARDLAQKANNLKSDFIRNMSYEVKMPLQSITEYSHLIADCVANSDHPEGDGKNPNSSGQHLKRFANLLELNTELLGTIINDVLRLSEIENAPLSTQSSVVQIKHLCDACLMGVRHRLKPGVTPSLDPQTDRVDLFTDPARLQQILNNMLTNAAKFTDSGSIVLSYRIDDEHKNMIFSVTDTGIGINPKNKDKIFDRFVKLDNNTQGAGLGLTISRILARHLGGDLWLDTSYKKGARFCLSIPLE